MIYNKLPLTDVQLMAQMKARGLLVKDDAKALSYLRNIGYYRLSQYLKNFQSKANSFIQGTDFDDVIKLYVFDRHLRLIIIEAIERIEISIRAEWANQLSIFYSDAHPYLKASNFFDVNKFNQMIDEIKRKIDGIHRYEKFIVHYKKHILIQKIILLFGRSRKFCHLVSYLNIIGIPKREKLKEQ